MFTPMNTKDHTTSFRKTLLYGHHGWGKTTQFKYYQEHFGKGLILSGESGLSSIRSAGIDYLPFTSWNGENTKVEEDYPFVKIYEWIESEDFKKHGYKWIGIDSLTELSDMSMKYATALAKKKAKEKGGNVDNFLIYGTHKNQIIGACKAIRDLQMHVLVTALAKESTDENGNTHYWPMIDGSAAQTALPGIFDNVFCGIRHTTKGDGGAKTIRYLITDEVNGWKGKVRDENRRCKSVEQCGNIVELFKRMDATEEEYKQMTTKKED